MKSITHYDQVGFIPEMQRLSNIWKSINVTYINGKKCKNDTMISIVAEKVFDKTISFHDKTKEQHVLDWIFVSVSNSYVQSLTSNVMVLGDGALGRQLNHEDGTLVWK